MRTGNFEVNFPVEIKSYRATCSAASMMAHNRRKERKSARRKFWFPVVTHRIYVKRYFYF